MIAWHRGFRLRSRLGKGTDRSHRRGHWHRSAQTAAQPPTGLVPRASVLGRRTIRARDDDERNEKQAREALLDHVGVPEITFTRCRPATDPSVPISMLLPTPMLSCWPHAESGAFTPIFDIHLLGMGGEGHINSLFPHTPPSLRPTGQW